MFNYNGTKINREFRTPVLTQAIKGVFAVSILVGGRKQKGCYLRHDNKNKVL